MEAGRLGADGQQDGTGHTEEGTSGKSRMKEADRKKKGKKEVDSSEEHTYGEKKKIVSQKYCRTVPLGVRGSGFYFGGRGPVAEEPVGGQGRAAALRWESAVA